MPAKAAAVTHPHLQALIAQGSASGPIPVAIAYPCDASSLESAAQACRARLIAPLLVGPCQRIQQAADTARISLHGMSA